MYNYLFIYILKIKIILLNSKGDQKQRKMSIIKAPKFKLKKVEPHWVLIDICACNKFSTNFHKVEHYFSFIHSLVCDFSGFFLGDFCLLFYYLQNWPAYRVCF
jgi:hypothetical protein